MAQDEQLFKGRRWKSGFHGHVAPSARIEPRSIHRGLDVHAEVDYICDKLCLCLRLIGA